jgi:hypothetical protein
MTHFTSRMALPAPRIRMRQSSNSYRRGCHLSPGPGPGPTSATCGAPYANYQGSEGITSHVAYLTVSSTGVTGRKNGDVGPGGIVRAVISRAGTDQPPDTFRRYDTTRYVAPDGTVSGYLDPNVPCGRSPIASWVIGDANPGPPNGQRHIIGWSPIRAAPEPPRPC